MARLEIHQYVWIGHDITHYQGDALLAPLIPRDHCPTYVGSPLQNEHYEPTYCSFHKKNLMVGSYSCLGNRSKELFF